MPRLSRPTLSLIFNVVLLPLPAAAWWAYVRSQSPLRFPVLLLAFAATLSLLGVLVWQGFSLAHRDEVPPTPGPRDAFFVVARILIVAAPLAAMRSVILPQHRPGRTTVAALGNRGYEA